MPAILYGNMKGGVGKTTNSVMTAYQLARQGYKTLVCDLETQHNCYGEPITCKMIGT